MNYLLDTNIISELVSKQPNQKVIDFLQNTDEDKLFLSSITIGEVKAGVEKLPNSKKKEQLSKWLHYDLLQRFESKIINIDTDIMLTWGSVTQQLKELGKPLPIMDSIIGATCRSKSLVLVTRNIKDFQYLDIEIVNPFDGLDIL